MRMKYAGAEGREAGEEAGWRQVRGGTLPLKPLLSLPGCFRGNTFDYHSNRAS